MINNGLRYAFGPVVMLSLVVLMLLPAGCAQVTAEYQDENPFVDDLPPTSTFTTASVEGVRYLALERPYRRRPWEPATCAAQDGTVTHWPLWWEDPFEDKGSVNGQFALTWEDGLAMPYGLGRFLVNTMFWPVSAVVTPPFTVMCSDGVLSRQIIQKDHDAIPCPSGNVPPIDMVEAAVMPLGEPVYEQDAPYTFPEETDDELQPAEVKAQQE